MSVYYDDCYEIKYFDVIFIGHLASVTAKMLASITKNNYKSLVLSNNFTQPKETQKTIIQPSLLPISTKELRISNKINQPSVQCQEAKTIHVKPTQNQVVLDGKKICHYKFLVYTGNLNDWKDFNSINTLNEAISNQYSFVYSNVKKRDIFSTSKKISSGNVVFYIPNGHHSGYDNFYFLSICEQIREDIKSDEQSYLKPLAFKVMLQGISFFPFCPEADKLFKKELKERGIQFFTEIKLTKIDYLRRTLTVNNFQEVPYNLFYCIIPQKVPDILAQAGIDPLENDPKTLLNKKYQNIFIFGADIFPTTHTFEAVQYQNHVVSQNLVNLLSQSGEITFFNGQTMIPVYLNNNQAINFSHYYSHFNQEIDQKKLKGKVPKKCGWFTYLTTKISQPYLTQSYYNYNSWGKPYYVFGPILKSVKFGKSTKEENNNQDVIKNK